MNTTLAFGAYRLDPQNEQLWRDQQVVRLTGKAFAILRHLVQRPNQLVSRAELFRSVWPDTVVSATTLTSCIKELRKALDDDARTPQYIETVHRRGFRFIGKVVSDQLSVVSREEANQKAKGKNQKAKIEDFFPTPNPQSPTPSFVGRESELTQLHGWLAKALNGERQIVFVTGEPGIGKTALVDTFLQILASRVQSQEEAKQKAKACPEPSRRSKNQKAKIETDPRPLTPVPQIGRGQCIEHYGVGEAYLPILEALGRLSREPDGQHLIGLLSQHAPTWLVQMSALLHPDEIETLQHKTAGATRERMLRELAEALEVITAEHPLVLMLEDLHWSDVSTLDLLSMLARRQESARLLIIGTYRPVEVLTRDHPLRGIKQELQLHGQCEELPLDFLNEAAVGEYLAVRFSVGATGRSPLRNLAHLIHRRTDGNPLFMVNVIDHLLSQGVLVQEDGQLMLQNEGLVATVPENLRQLIEQQIDRVTPDKRKILEAASVAGAEFSTAVLAAGVETTVEIVEEHCAELARREQFLRTSGTAEWPDGTIAARYGFVHALYQEVLYEQISATRRSRLHRQIGEREEQGYGERAREIATELAVHFERGRNYRRAIQYLQYAGENAIQRSANQETISLLTKGLELLKTLPDTSERDQQEFGLQIALGAPLMATEGPGSLEVGKTCTRTLELCQQIGDTQQHLLVLGRLLGFHLAREELQRARELGEQCLSLAQHMHDPDRILGPHHALGHILFSLGELVVAREHLEQGIILYDSQKHRFYTSRGDVDPGVGCLSYAALALWFLGYPDQAQKRSHEAFTVAVALSHPYSLAFALNLAATLQQFRRESQATQEKAESAITLCTEQGFPYYLAWGTILRGCALTEQGKVEEGIAQIRQGLSTHQATGAERHRPYFLTLLAAAYGKAGRAEEGFVVLSEALEAVNKTGGRVWEAELYRLRGELTFQSQTSLGQVSDKSKGKSQK